MTLRVLVVNLSRNLSPSLFSSDSSMEEVCVGLCVLGTVSCTTLKLPSHPIAHPAVMGTARTTVEGNGGRNLGNSHGKHQVLLR